MNFSKGPNHKRLFRLQKKIYLSLKAEIRQLIGNSSESIRPYEAEFKKDFRKARISTTSQKELIHQIRNSEVIFIGDFHTFPQAQKASIRLIKESGVPYNNCILGLEMISSSFQKALDDFQEGKITEKKFLKLIHYRDEWGFPWKNYKIIFEFAREHGVKLIALNRPKELDLLNFNHLKNEEEQFKISSNIYELTLRDHWSACLITDAFLTGIAHDHKVKIFVLYGELHLGNSHLPKALKQISKSSLGRPIRSLIVHQNRDELYWKLASQGCEMDIEILKLTKSSFCVFSGTPWARLQSLLSWIEGEGQGQANFASHGNGIAEVTFEMNEDSNVDYLSIIRNCGQTIAKFIGIEQPEFDNFSACTITEADFIFSLSKYSNFSRTEIGLIKKYVTTNQRIYIPKAEIAYLATPSLNGSAELAAKYLLQRSTNSMKIFSGDADDFYRLIMDSAFAFFCSLILNPLRKCDHLADHISRLRELQHEKGSALPREADARKFAISMLKAQPAHLRSGKIRNNFVPLRIMGINTSFSFMIAAQYVGNILGRKLHKAMLRETATTSEIRKLFLSPPKIGEKYCDRYLMLLRMSSLVTIPSKNSALVLL